MIDNSRIIKHEKLTLEEREQVKELRRMHIGEHAERSWLFESEVRVALAEHAPVAVAEDAAKMLREVMFWESKAEHRDFWVYRVVKCKECDPDPEHNCCWHKVGLSRRNVESARELLVALDLLEYTDGKGMSTGFHNRTHYRVTHVNMHNLLDLLEKPLPEGPNEVYQHSRYERTNSVGTNVQTLTESTHREDAQSKYLHEGKDNNTYPSSPLLGGRGGGVGSYVTDTRPTGSTPDGVDFEFEVQESHDGQHNENPSDTDLRESETFLGARIARSVQARLEDFHAYHLTDEEFATIEKDANALQRDGFDLAGLYEVADVLVDGFAHNGKLGRI